MSTIDWGAIVERRIEEAQREGHFDNLPGEGRPLDLREPPHVRPEWRLAHKILKNGGFTLDWIELDQTIRAEWAQCKRLLENQLAWANRVQRSEDHSDGIDAELSAVYSWTVAAYKRRAAALNEKIELFNLTVPLMHLQKHKVDVVEELRKFRELWPQRTSAADEALSAPPPSPTLDTQRRQA